MDSAKVNPACIYTTLVMLSDDYIPGAIVLAQSLRRSGTKYPIWCMVAGVSMVGLDTLRQFFDKVVEVPIIEKRVVPLKSAKQNQIYGGWISKSFTKWNIFNPGIFGHSKVLFLDADILVLSCLDELFTLPAPAATFSSPWVRPYAAYGYNPYGEMLHGAEVPYAKIREGFKSILGIGSVVLVQPKKSAWKTFQMILDRDEVYGAVKCTAGFDEQMLAEIFLALGGPIYHIHQRYNWFVGKNKWLTNGDVAKVYHYYGAKPWQQPRNAWPDLAAWWQVADEIIAATPKLADAFNAKN